MWKEIKNVLKNTRQHLMNGVSYMLPFVVAGGVIMAISVAIYGQGGVPPEGTFLHELFNLGGIGLGYMVPILSGFIAFSIADRAGIAPGVIGGAVAASIGAGFIGGIISGLLTGIICYILKNLKVPAALKSIMPIIIIPITATLLVWLVIVYVVGTPIAALMTIMENFLTHMNKTNRILLGLVMGAMIGFDLGGPVNKVAFSFGVATVGSGIFIYAGPMDVAICTPPLGMFLATIIAKNRFTKEEQSAGKSALVMGLVGISEGAIPFAGNDPFRVIAATMSGSAVGAAVAYALNVTAQVAWGGLIILPVVGNKIGYIISVVAGSLVTAIVAVALKKPITEETVLADASVAVATEEIDIDFD